jgi:hypothetical protein
MARSKPTNEKNVAELVDEFKRDIIYDCHSFRVKLSRSDAGKELVKKGRESLRGMITHLRAYKTDEETQLAFACLLNEIEIQIDPDKTAPRDLKDMDGWLVWAERFA